MGIGGTSLTIKIALCFMAIVVAGCGNSSDPAATLKSFAEGTSEISYIYHVEGYMSDRSEKDKKIASEKISEIHRQIRLFRDDAFEERDFLGFMQLVDYTYLDRYAQSKQKVPVDVGKIELNGERASGHIYVANNACESMLRKNEGWKIVSLKCPDYYDGPF